MAIFESELVYSMMARDALIILPPRLQNTVDTTNWPKEARDRIKVGGDYKRRLKPVMEQLHPALEDALIEPIKTDKVAENHLHDVADPDRGQLANHTVAACGACKKHLGDFMHGRAGWEMAIMSMGKLAHCVIDLCNPFHLTSDPMTDIPAGRFMNDVELHITDMPFMWALADKDHGPILKATPFMDKMSIHVEAQRRHAKWLKALADPYLVGNGFPSGRGAICQWYDETVNTLGRAWLFCAQ